MVAARWLCSAQDSVTGRFRNIHERRCTMSIKESVERTVSQAAINKAVDELKKDLVPLVRAQELLYR